MGIEDCAGVNPGAGWMDSAELDVEFSLLGANTLSQIRDGFRTQQRFVDDLLLPRRDLTWP